MRINSSLVAGPKIKRLVAGSGPLEDSSEGDDSSGGHDSVDNRHRNTGARVRLDSGHPQQPIAIIRLQLLTINGGGKAETPTPGAGAEFTHQSDGLRLFATLRIGLVTGWAIGLDAQGAIGGVDLKAGSIDARELNKHFIGMAMIKDFRCRNAVGTKPLLLQLLIKAIKRFKGRSGAKGTHGGDRVGELGRSFASVSELLQPWTAAKVVHTVPFDSVVTTRFGAPPQQGGEPTLDAGTRQTMGC